MTKFISFDVLIVYNGKLAFSATNKLVKAPFRAGSSNEKYNDVYAYFLKKCHQSGLTAGFATSSDIISPGLCRSFWQLEDAEWVKVNSPCYSTLIFDKFSPTGTKGKLLRELLFSSTKVKPFNDPDLFNLFFDKQKTYDKLSEYSIPTVSLKENTLASLKKSCLILDKLIDNHSFSFDFGSDIIIKDRFGAGGRRVYKFNLNNPQDIESLFSRNTHASYIVQPFTKFDQGFTYSNRSAPTDIRLIYLNNKIVQSYIRVAKSGEFRCNEHKGGLLTYLSLNKLPSSLIAKSNQIAKVLNKRLSLFALDFLISNTGHSYFLEGNTGPGLDWDVSRQKNEIEAKKLINLIAQNLNARVGKKLVSHQESFISSDIQSTFQSHNLIQSQS